MVDGYRPNNLNDALDLINKEDLTVIAGGTDLMVKNARGTGLSPKFQSDLLFINNIKELKKIEISKDHIEIGACVTLTELEYNDKIPELFRKIISEIAATPTRNIATIGGNICNASPAADTLPFLYAANAKVVLSNISKTRILGINEFISGPGKKEIKENELLVKIIIPNRKFDAQFYKKVGTRQGMALSKLSFVGLMIINSGKVQDIRLAFGAVGSTVVRSKILENEIIGNILEKNKIDSIIQKYEKVILPIDDSRSTKKYRLNVSLNLLRQFLNQI